MRTITSILNLCLAVLLLAGPAFASYTVNVEAARDFISEGQYDNAISLLEKTVEESHEASEAFYLLGVARLWAGDCDRACERFRRALELDPSLQDQMREQVKERIFERLRDGDLEGARSALTVAVRYDPGLGREIAQSCVNKGGGYIETGDVELADDLFRFIAEVDPSLSSAICELLYSKARSATGEESLKLVLASMHYGGKYQKGTTRMVLNLANDLEDEGARQKYLVMADRFLEPEVILQASVEYYTGRWGTPGKVSLTTPGTWTSADKLKRDDTVRYLTMGNVLTRGVGGPMKIPPALYRASLFPGLSTSAESSYSEMIWFTPEKEAATVFYWFIPPK
jgi:tetratricopeptide (TPR) repeat protein